jgi:ABC-type multidrug transport system permease subunit
MDAQFHAVQIRPPSEQEMELLVTISAISFVVALIAMVFFISYFGYLLLRTRLPGRVEAFVGVFLFSTFFGWTQYMGGNLEVTLGPVGILLNVIVWYFSAVLFLVGHFRMLRRFRRCEQRG